MGRDLETVWIFGSVVLPSIDNVCLDKQTEITVIVQWALVFFGFLVGLFGSSLFSSWWAWPEVLFILKKKKKKKQSVLIDYFLFFYLYLIYFLSDLHYFLSSDYALSILPFLIVLGSSLGAYLRFFLFLKKACIALNFPLRIGVAPSHRFCMAVVSLSFVSRYF